MKEKRKIYKEKQKYVYIIISGQFYKKKLAKFTLILAYCLTFWLKSVN